jgi:hypothetical protein
METCRPVHPAQVVPLRAVKCMPHLHRAVARKQQHNSQAAKTRCRMQASARVLVAVCVCDTVLGRAPPACAVTIATAAWKDHSKRARRAVPCIWRVELSVLPIGVDLAHPYGSALNFAGDTIPLITWLHGYTAARPCSFGRGTGSCLPASVRTWPCDAPAPIDSQGTDKEVTPTRSRRSHVGRVRFSHT